MGIVVTISGLHGTGKSTYARALAEEFRLRHISAGMLFREMATRKGLSVEELSKLAEVDPEIDRIIDERTKMEAKKGSVVIDGQLAGWMAKDHADIRIFLTAPDRVRIERLAHRDNVDYQEAERQTRLREEIEWRRYRKFYDVDIRDTSIYDLVLNTALLPIDSSIKVLKDIVREYITHNLRGR
ncbi:AAA family ATPase [Candidatus Bathyarchaeota archaeon]|nr:AAA family ATPase [Candidatus Bathyarchaeota archaeon]